MGLRIRGLNKYFSCFFLVSFKQEVVGHTRHINKSYVSVPFPTLAYSKKLNMGKLSFFSFLSVLCIQIIAFPGVILQSKPVMALPLYTNSRWIVDEGGQRVKLACVNWVAHLQPLVPEGLSKQPMDTISKKIKSMGFNCVRLTWPTFLATNDSLASLTVRQSFQNLGLVESIAGIQANNPSVIDLSVMQAFQVTAESLNYFFPKFL